MAIEAHASSADFALVPDEGWADLDPELAGKLDPGLAWVVSLIEAGEWDQVYWRTGIRLDAEREQRLPLLLQYAAAQFSPDTADKLFHDLGLEVAPAYLSGERASHVTARIVLPPGLVERTDSPLRAQIIAALTDPHILRLELPASVQALNHDAQRDIGLRHQTRKHGGKFLDGTGVVIGIIDDGCALGHRNFMKPRNGSAPLESRILFLWDQARTDTNGGWNALPDREGLELTKAVIDNAIGVAQAADSDAIDEEAVYRRVNYRIADLASHGTHVMDIAAGNGESLEGSPGMAPRADIIFVQLPTETITSGGHALDHAIVDGVNYIFEKAGAAPAVINISYGGYWGPHDGTSFVEESIDLALAQPNRAVVVAAGNGYEADCHARGTLPNKNDTDVLRWIVKPEDPTPNDLEVWYNRSADLVPYLVAPDGTRRGPIPLGPPPVNIVIGSVRVGRVHHQKVFGSATMNRIRVHLNQTRAKDTPTGSNPAPAGTWRIELENRGNVEATYDAWIERDTLGRPGGARLRQSHFHPDDADVQGTLASYATGKLAVSVGAYNSATHEVCRYSACGPTRDGREKPDVLAPAEEDAAGRGVLCASSRSADPTRMNGTSAAAPQVTGLIALLFQYAKSRGETLGAADVLSLVRTGAANGATNPLSLRANRHVEVDAGRKDKQDDNDVWPYLIGEGKISWPDTINLM